MTYEVGPFFCCWPNGVIVGFCLIEGLITLVCIYERVNESKGGKGNSRLGGKKEMRDLDGRRSKSKGRMKKAGRG